ncbi:class I SAM-dependent methyltransferase [Peptostreptococcus sp. D1]|uniref:class I SAM-dependent methyltransferase n=1 Tax=Peptostreptococcus sp. D1 TaxID=72304 RepID=UPI0008F439E3|nr:class I SAM-dependent methyltransferase [Peptostreptococcus sp. D1]SFE42447.1 Putative rRNA methylase [Peptostreptococcus sp. D1]
MNDFNNVNSVIKLIIGLKVKENSIVLDCTVGNGNDTEYLSSYLGDKGFIYGFDIQQNAIEATKTRLSSIGFENYQLFFDGHENIDKHIKEEIDFAVYNLGYLPKSDHMIITKSETTIQSISKAMDLLSIGGCICVASYISHDNGVEYHNIKKFLKSVDQQHFNVAEMDFVNQKNFPAHLFIIEKRN